MDAEETAIQRWRELGFDETIAISPGDTIRFTASERPVDSTPEVSLPRISVDLPSTMRGRAETPEVTPLRAELEVRTILGEGGVGRVFLARQRSAWRGSPGSAGSRA